MTINMLRRKVRAAHIPDVARLTKIPLRTLYRFANATTATPRHETVRALERWALW